MTARKTRSNDGSPEVPEGHVSLKLAHPLSAAQAELVRPHGDIPDEGFGVGEEIVVTRDYGLALIESGLVQVDPENRKLVRRVLGLNGKMQPLTADELAVQDKEPSELSPATPA